MVSKDVWEKHWDNIYSGYRFPEQSLYEFLMSHPNKSREIRKALYLGVGNGRDIPALTAQGYYVTAVDISREAVERANQFFYDIQIDKLAGAHEGIFEHLLYRDDSFNLAVDIRSVMHQSRDGVVNAIKEVSRVLKPDGLFFSVMKTPMDALFGEGEEIGRNTFIHPRFGEIFFPCHAEIPNIFASFSEVSIGTEERNISGTPKDRWSHWIIIAKK